MATYSYSEEKTKFLRLSFPNSSGIGQSWEPGFSKSSGKKHRTACGKIGLPDTIKKYLCWSDCFRTVFVTEERNAFSRRPARTGGSNLKRLANIIKSLALILWISLGAVGRFWRWRLSLWLHPDRLMESTQKSMKQTLLFIRHGQTTWNVEHLLPGQLPGVELTEFGREQAERLAEALNVLPLTAIISSPLERARDTAAYLARSRDLPVLIEDDLKDTNVGHWAGQNYDELRKNDPAWNEFVRNPSSAPEGIETFPEVQQRVTAAVERWLKEESIGNYLAFVAHADVVKLLLANYMGLDVARAGWLSIDNASVSIVELEQEQSPRVVAIGWNPQPGWLKPPVPAPADPPAQIEESQAGKSAGESQA